MEIPRIGTASGKIAKEGAQAAIGVREPAAVTISTRTPLTISEAQRTVAQLAARGVPPSEVVTGLTDLWPTDLLDLDTVAGRELFVLQRAGYESVADVVAASPSEFLETPLLDEDHARNIYDEAVREG